MEILTSIGASAVDTVFIAANALEILLLPFCFFVLLGIVRLRGRFITDIKRILPESRLNLLLFVLNTVLMIFLFPLMVQTLDAIFFHAGLRLIPVEFWLELPPLLTIVIFVFLGDFIGYWRHRFEHTPMLWPSHAVHHSDTQMTWLTLQRFHPINRVTTYLIDNGILLALGAPPFALLVNSIIRHYYGYFIHSDLPWTYGRLGRIFISPAMHRWHHASDARFFQCNFATVFSLWDQAFGTYNVPGPCRTETGILSPIKPSLWAQLSYAFKPEAYARIINGKASLLSWKGSIEDDVEAARLSAMQHAE